MIDPLPPVSSEPVRVALVTPGGAIRAGLRALLAAGGRFQIVAEMPFLPAEDGLPEQADVLIITSGPARQLDWPNLLAAEPGLSILFLCSDDETGEIPLEQLGLRAWGILPLDVDSATLAAAVQALYEGLLVGAPVWMSGLFERRAHPGKGFEDSDPLTPREVDVLAQLAQGLTNKQIALALGISEHTVKYHISAIYGKLGALNRAEAVRVGVRRGWIAI